MNLRNQIESLPKSPGVYKFINPEGVVIYIGKAKIIRNRVANYFNSGGDQRPMIGQLVSQIVKIEYIECDSEVEALILESALISKIRPKYNARLKDDKSYQMIKISADNFPRVSLVRYADYQLKKISREHYFGPFPESGDVKKALKILRKIFLFADCNQQKFTNYQKRGRACLFGMIGNCQAPCIGKISEEGYKKELDFLLGFLRGQKKSVISSIEKEMKISSNKHQFERAAFLRDRLNTLRKLNQNQVINDDFKSFYEEKINRIEAFDISNISGELSVGSMSVVIDSKSESSEYRRFRIKTVFGINDPAMIAEVLKRRLAHREWPLPDLIVIDGGEGQFAAAKGEIQKSRQKIRLIAIAKGPSRKDDRLIYEDPELEKIIKKEENTLREIKYARDEAHRFAVKYFHERQLKNLIHSKNDS
jgi:excinuclease ABC subunit C